MDVVITWYNNPNYCTRSKYRFHWVYLKLTVIFSKCWGDIGNGELAFKMLTSHNLANHEFVSYLNLINLSWIWNNIQAVVKVMYVKELINLRLVDLWQGTQTLEVDINLSKIFYEGPKNARYLIYSMFEIHDFFFLKWIVILIRTHTKIIIVF